MYDNSLAKQYSISVGKEVTKDLEKNYIKEKGSLKKHFWGKMLKCERF